MPRFPLSEADIAELAREVAAGLAAHGSVYPAPPVDAAALQARIDAYKGARADMIQAQAMAQQATAMKTEALHELVHDVKSVLRYAENVTDMQDALLKLLGWGAPRPRHPRALPGEPGDLRPVREGPGWIHLRWKTPSEGGKPAVYRVERRRPGVDEWVHAGAPLKTEITLEDQPRGVLLEYRVIAINHSGQGVPSNTVEATL